MASTSMCKRWLAPAGLILVLAATAWLAWATARGGGADTGDKPARAALPADLNRVPRDAVGFLSLRVADLWSSALLKEVRPVLLREAPEALDKVTKLLGVSPEQIERLTLVMTEIGPRSEPVALVATRKPYDRKAVLEMLGAETKTETYLGHKLRVSPDGRRALHLYDERTYVFGDVQPVKEFLGFPRDKEEGPLSEALRQAATGHGQVLGVNGVALSRNLNRELATTNRPLPAEARPYLPLLKATSATAVLDLGEEARIDVRIRFDNDRDTRAGVRAIRKAWHLANVQLTNIIEEVRQRPDTKSIVRLLQLADDALDSAKIEQKDSTVTAALRAPLDTKTIGGLLLMDAVKKVRISAARAQSQNNLKQISLAVLNYADSNNYHLPPHAIYDKNGKPTLSWRVLILPYLDQGALYKQFHLDEPWDSPHNKKLLAKMPAVYAAADPASLKNHTTYYQGFHGKGAVFEGKKGVRFPADIPDGTSNTILVVEAAKPVPWTRPDDIPFKESREPGKELLEKVGGRFPNGFNAAFCDGSVRFISRGITPQTLQSAITRNGGEVLGSDF